METENFANWLEIDLGAVQNNVRQLKALTGTTVCAVVKANAYGHGMVEVARAAVKAGAGWCGVARMDEALGLRKAGITAPILLLGYLAPGLAAEAAAENISVPAYDRELAAEYSAKALASGHKLKVHAKIDTGLSRLGVLAAEGVEFVRYLHTLPGLEVEGSFTHYARADAIGSPETTLLQLKRYNQFLEGVTAIGLRPRVVSSANSAATIYYPDARFDLVRPGIAVLGMNPSDEAVLPSGFRQALTWKCRLISVKTVPAGEGISYGHRYKTTKNERIGVIAAGYGDGFRRAVPHFALLRGKRVKVVGGICMDQCMVQLDELPDARIGDEVVLLGKQGEAEITSEELGSSWGTVNYDVITSIEARVQRVYIGS